MHHPTKQKLIEAGLTMLLEHGYNDLGIQALLAATGTPKGSFYHHFHGKEDFAMEVVDAYMQGIHGAFAASLHDRALPPLDRIRRFFALVEQSYRSEGYMGCLLGGLGQELSGISPAFRRRIEECFAEIASHFAACLEEAQLAGDLRPDADSRHLAELLVNCWEGAALRSRLRGDASPLMAMVDFYFGAVRSKNADH